MKKLYGIIIFLILGWEISGNATPPVCPNPAAIISTANNLQVDNPYADGYKVHENSNFGRLELWWLVIPVDFSYANSKEIALQLVKDGINSLQLTSGPELNPNHSWWFCFYTETTMAGPVTGYVSTQIE